MDLDQAWGCNLQRNRTSGYDVPSSPKLIVYVTVTVSGSAGNMVNCLEIEPYMFEPVCQSGESESNDSHADTDRVGNSSLLGHCPFGLDVNLIFKGTEASWEGTKATFHPSPGAPRPV